MGQKILMMFFALGCLQHGFGQSDILNRKVSISFENQSVKDALTQLRKQENFFLIYADDDISNRLINEKFQEALLGDVIQKIWGKKNVRLKTSGKTVSILSLQKGNVRGRLTDNKGNTIPYALVTVKGTTLGSVTNEFGNFEIQGVLEGLQVLAVSSIGYTPKEKEVRILPNTTNSVNIELPTAVSALDEVVVEGLSVSKEIAQNPIKVEAIDAKSFALQSVGAAEILKTAPGVLVRRSGGLGSNANVNLNGLQGNAVRIYIDGFPVEYLGGGYNLNNLPGGVIDRLEVYKGVVPADKATDALGGAVNIVSKRLYDDRLELSYQVGSFNTHRASFLASKKVKEGFAITLEGYYNYSDNDFLMGNVRNIVVDSIPDRFGNGLIPSTRADTLDRVRRFHDTHRSSFLQVGLYWSDLSWADQLSFSSNFSNRFDEVQTLNITQGFALLGRTGETTAFNQSLNYVKTLLDKKLELKYRGVVSNSIQAIQNNNTNRVNWNREIIPAPRPIDTLDLETEGFNHAHRFSASYKVNENHGLSIYNFYARSRFFRKDNRNPFIENDGELINRNELPSFFTKNVASIEWRGDWLNKKLSSVVFGKYYFYNAETIVPFNNSSPNLEVKDSELGYGGALKYAFTDRFFIRGSYEFAVRIPTEREVYGDFVNINSNFNLRPERSDNFNLGITYEKSFPKVFRINTSLDGFVRDTKDLIWLTPDGAFQQFRNNRAVRSLGVEWSFKATRDDYSNIEFNLTTQERTYQGFNFDELTRQDPAFIGSRFPNTPSFFYNLQLNVGIKSIKSTLPNIVVYGSWFHVQEFSITDEPINGEPEPSSLVPTQNEFNIGVGYFLPNNRLSLSFQVNNLTNDFELFDNWRVPKPNRNFQFKINYQIF
ncbi:MAG: TonB-dependent receptor [Bacteroidota bacterium]